MQEIYHILVVEDDSQIRDGIEIYLKRKMPCLPFLRRAWLFPAWISEGRSSKDAVPEGGIADFYQCCRVHSG